MFFCLQSSFAQSNERWSFVNTKKNIHGNFLFRNFWSYPEGVYLSAHNQLSCDGLCPVETDAMKDSTGRIYADTLESFYSLVDTSHIQHSFSTEGFMYEWAGSKFMTFTRLGKDTLVGRSALSVSTHTSLRVIIVKDRYTAWLDYNSIALSGEHSFPLEQGRLDLDKKLLRKGIVKASFEFYFKNTLEPDQALNCKGLIYSEIE